MKVSGEAVCNDVGDSWDVLGVITSIVSHYYSGVFACNFCVDGMTIWVKV